MKRILAVLIMLGLLMGLLMMSGCEDDSGSKKSNKKNNSASEKSDESEDDEDEEKSDETTKPDDDVPDQTTEPGNATEPLVPPSLASEDLREQMNAQGKRFAVAYLGYMPYTDGTVASFLERNAFLMQKLPFLRELSEENVSCNSTYGEVYCILTADPDAEISLYSGSFTDTYDLVYEDLIFEGTCEGPVIVVCNTSYHPDTMVQIDCSDDTTDRWYPQLDEYCFVEGLWGGEFSASEDGYDTLDVTPYKDILLAEYELMRDDPLGAWQVPAEEDLIGTAWRDEGYDINGNYYLYRMDIREGIVNINWTYDGGDVNQYQNAEWSLETKNGIAVLTIDLGGFAGVRSYNILIDKENGYFYTAVDATSGEIVNQWERLNRYLYTDATEDVSDMVGTWERTYTEVEGDRQESLPGECHVEITGDGSSGFFITYTNTSFPDSNFTECSLVFTSAEEYSFLDDCIWVAMVEGSDSSVTHYVAMADESTLILVNTWTMEEIPMISFEEFARA